MRSATCAFVLVAAACAPPSLSPERLASLPPLDETLPPLDHGERALDGPAVEAEAARLIEVRETEGALARAIALLRWHVARQPSPRLHVLLAEAHARTVELAALLTPDDRAKHARHRAAGVAHAEEALRLTPDDPIAHFWRGALLLHAAGAEQSLGKAKGAMAEFERADRDAPTYDHAGASRLLGRLHQKTPLIGSRSKAIAYYRRSIELAPDFAQTRLWLGETLGAREELERAVAQPCRVGHEVEDGVYRRQARALLAKLDGK